MATYPPERTKSRFVALDSLSDDRIGNALALLRMLRQGVAPRTYFAGAQSTAVLTDLRNAGLVEVRPVGGFPMPALEVVR